MSRLVIFGAGVTVLLAVVGWRITELSNTSERPFEGKNKPPEAAPLCPWRETDADLKRFFPSATRYELETRILSGLRVELAERLGRVPTGDENALHVYRIYADQTPLGAVLTRRVKGDYGAIELVLAVNPDGEVRGLRLQRLREPEPIASALQHPSWLGAFEGKRAGNSLQIGHDLPEVPTEARASADAIIDGTRSLLILLATSDHARAQRAATAKHH